MTYEISVESETMEPTELRKVLEQDLPSEDISLELRKQSGSIRLEPVVLIAIITGGFQVLTALITGLLTLAKDRKKTDKISIEDPSGTILEIPAGTSTEIMHQQLEGLRGRNVTRIVLISQY